MEVVLSSKLNQYEQQVLTKGLSDTGLYFDRCFEVAQYEFLRGNSLQHAIKIARKKFGF